MSKERQWTYRDSGHVYIDDDEIYLNSKLEGTPIRMWFIKNNETGEVYEGSDSMEEIVDKYAEILKKCLAQPPEK